MSLGLAQHLLARVQHESHRAEIKLSAEHERKKKYQAETSLPTEGGETMRQDACGGFGPGSVPSFHSFPAKSLKLIIENQLCLAMFLWSIIEYLA